MKSCLLIFALFLYSGYLHNQDQENIREEVQVVNIEVPVRVYHKGEPVLNLTRKDFKVFEGKKLQTINGFYQKTRKLKTSEEILYIQNSKLKETKPRLFILVFHLIHYNNDLRRGVSYLFKHLITEKDHILVFANNKTLLMSNTSENNRKTQLERILQEESTRAKHRLTGYFNKIQRNLDFTKIELEMKAQSEANIHIDTRPAQIISFLKYYLSTWREYKRKYLLPDIDKFHRFATFLSKINREKWVLNFYQTEMFPKMKWTGELRQQIELIISQMQNTDGEGPQYAKMIMSLLKDIELELNVARDFDAAEISKFFYRVDATFHSIFSRIQKESNSVDLEYKTVSTDIENSLREITAKTGGALVATNDMKSALDALVEHEDSFYMLTFAPFNPKKINKIRVETINKKYRVIYDNNKRADYIKEYLEKKDISTPDISIQSISFKKKQLFLSIGGFLIQTQGLEKYGRIKVHVWIINQSNRIVYDQSRYLRTPRNFISVAINFDWLERGEYSIFVDTTDIETGKNSLNFLQSHIQKQ